MNLDPLIFTLGVIKVQYSQLYSMINRVKHNFKNPIVISQAIVHLLRFILILIERNTLIYSLSGFIIDL